MSNQIDVEDLGSSSDQDPQPLLQKYDYIKDQGLHTGTMWFLGLATLLCILGSIILTVCDKDTPELLAAIGGASIAALATLFKPK